MLALATKRVIISGWKNFVRGGAVSGATVVIMTVTLGIIASLIFLSALLSYTLLAIKEKVDVSVYFVTTASESQIMEVKSQIEKLPQVAQVSYTSAADALAKFREEHASDQITLQALDELGGNPLDASLAIRAKDPAQFESIVNFLNTLPALSVSGTSIVDRINYAQNKDVIDRLTFMLTATRQVGLVVFAIFALASVLIAFATIRLAIYTSKDEIAVMRLVGASNAYIQGPFMITGLFAGLLAGFVVVALLWPVTWYVGSRTVTWFGGFNVSGYYLSHLPLLFVVLVGAGALLGVLASALAIRRYLKA